MALDALDSTKVLGQVTKLKDIFGYDEETGTYNNREGLGEYLSKFDKGMMNQEKKQLLYDSLGVTYIPPTDTTDLGDGGGGDDFVKYEGDPPSFVTEDLAAEVKGREKAAVTVLNNLKSSEQFEEYKEYYALAGEFSDWRQGGNARISKRDYIRSDEGVVNAKNEYYEAMRAFGHGGMFSNEATMFLRSSGGFGYAGGMLADNTREGVDSKFEGYFTNRDGTKKKGYSVIKAAREKYFQAHSDTSNKYSTSLSKLDAYENKYFSTTDAQEEYKAYEKSRAPGPILSYEEWIAEKGYDFAPGGYTGNVKIGYHKDVTDAINALNLIREELDVLNERPESISEYEFFRSKGLE